MGYGQVLQQIITDTSNLMIDSMNFWAGLVDDANDGSLDVKTAIEDVVKLLQRGATLWWSPIERGDPLPPVAYFEETPATISGATRQVSLAEALPDTADLKAGPLIQLGGAKTLAVADPTVEPGQLYAVITVKVTGPTGAPPVAGEMYTGIVYSNGTIIATVIARIVSP